MILTVGGIKGGSGKTTVATNFACIAAIRNVDVLLVDADDQETASDFTTVRKEDYPDAARYTCTKLTGKAVRTEILELAPKYDHIIVDTGGRDTTSQRAALAVSQLLLVPFVPRSFDIWTLNKVATLVDEMRSVNPALAAYVFLNRPTRKGREPRMLKRPTCLAKSTDSPISMPPRQPQGLRSRCHQGPCNHRTHRPPQQPQGRSRDDGLISTLF